MTLAINFINTDRNEAIEKFISSLVLKSFPETSRINDFIINLQTQSDHRVPWKCSIHVFGRPMNVIGESQAANYLTAFSQALTRVKRQWEKGEGIRA